MITCAVTLPSSTGGSVRRNGRLFSDTITVCGLMKGLRWLLAFLRDPVVAVGSAVATIRDRIASLESRIQQHVVTDFYYGHDANDAV